MLIRACFTFTGITNNGYIEQNTPSRGVRFNPSLTVCVSYIYMCVCVNTHAH
jgi:hypothetical protein